MKWMNFLWQYASAKTVRACHKKEHLPAKFSTCGGRDIPAKTCQDHPRAIIWITNHSRRTALQYRPSFCLDCWVTPFAGWRHWSILWAAHPPDQRNCRLKRLIKPIKAEWVHYSSSCVHYVALGLLWCRPRCGHFCMQPLSIIPLMFLARILTCQGCQCFRPVFESNRRWKSNFKIGFYAKGGKITRVPGDPEWDVKTALQTTALVFVMLRISGYQGQAVKVVPWMLKLTVLQYFRMRWHHSALELCFGSLIWQSTGKLIKQIWRFQVASTERTMRWGCSRVSRSTGTRLSGNWCRWSEKCIEMW